MENKSPLSMRTNLLVFIDQTGGSGVSIEGPKDVYRAPLWALSAVTWHELHHLATTQQHKEPSWPYSGEWAAAMERIKAGLAAQMLWDPITKRKIPVNAPGWHVANIVCGCRSVV